MRFIIATCFLLFNNLFLQAQNVGIGTTTPDKDAILELQSKTQGFLPPRLDSTQIQSISAPPEGLTVFNTSIKAIEVFNGQSWVVSAHFIGENYGGGIVFYTYDNGQHGLIASYTDQSSNARWNAGTNTNTMAYGGGSLASTGIGAGRLNTALIIASQGLGDGTQYGARAAAEYSITVDGVTYDDWYLPSLHELNLLYLQKDKVGGFAAAVYLSSSEFDVSTCLAQGMSSGTQGYTPKSNTGYHVRAIRSF